MTEEMVEISIEQLRAIAHYYEFPLAVFFLPKGEYKKLKEGNVRSAVIKSKATAFDEIAEIVDDTRIAGKKERKV